MGWDFCHGPGTAATLSASRLAHCDLGTDHSHLMRQLVETCARLQQLRLALPMPMVASSSLATLVSFLDHILNFAGVGLILWPRAGDSGIPMEALRGTFSHSDPPQGVSSIQSFRIFLALFSLSQVSLSDDDGTRSGLLQKVLLSSCELKSFRYVDLHFP